MTALCLMAALAALPAGDEFFAPATAEITAAALPFERMLATLARGEPLADPAGRLSEPQRKEAEAAIQEARTRRVFVRAGVAPGCGAATPPLVWQAANWLGILNFSEVLVVMDEGRLEALSCPKGSPYLLRRDIGPLLKPHQPADLAGAIRALARHIERERGRITGQQRRIHAGLVCAVVVAALVGLWLARRGGSSRTEVDDSQASPCSWKTVVLLAVLLAVALWLRLWSLDAQSFWVDEEWSRVNGGQPTLAQVARIVWIGDNHPPLYYLLMHGWIGLFGDGDTAARSLSVVFGLVLVALGFFVGRAWWGERAGWIAAALLAAMPQAIHFSQEARMYSLLGLGLMAVFAAMRGFLAKPTAARGCSLAAAMTAALYTHYYGMFIVAAAGLVAAGLWASGAATRQAFGRFAIWSSLAVMLFMPWFGHFLERLHNSDNVAYLMKVPTWKQYARALVGPFFSERYVPGLRVLPAMLASLAAVVACLWLRRNERCRGAGWVSAGMWALPAGLLWLQAQAGAAWNHERLMMLVAPGLALMLGGAAAGLGVRWGTPTAGAALVLFCLAQTPRLLKASPHEGWRDAAEFVIANAAGRDAVYTDPSNRIHEALCRRYLGNRLPFRTMPLLADAAFVAQALPEAQRVWIIASTMWLEKTDLVRALERSPGWRCAQDRRFPHVRAWCFERTHQRIESGS